jgi:transcriptional regulator with GAF, ATPase, and Fis domain
MSLAPVRAALERLGVQAREDPLAAVDALLARDRASAGKLVDALAAAVAQVPDEAQAAHALVAMGSAQLALGQAAAAHGSLKDGLALLKRDDPAVARATLRLATAEVAAGDRQAARNRLVGLASGLGAADDALLGELGAALRGTNEVLAAEAVALLRRARASGGAGGLAPDRAGRFELLSRIVSVLNSGAAGTTEPLYAILRTILDESGGDRGFLMLYGDDSALRFEVGLTRDGRALSPHDFAYSTTIVERALEGGAATIVPDLTAALPFATATSARELGLRAAICAPLKVERRRAGATTATVQLQTVRGVAGVLYVDATTAGSFGAGDTRFAEVLADCAVLAVRAKRTADALARATSAQPAAARPARPRPRAPGAPEEGAAPEVVLRNAYDEIITRDAGVRSMLALIDRVAPTDACVLIRGESGSGKELVARAIHRVSARASGPFVAIDCGAVPETLVQHELFGHEKAAFTGADDARPGLLERAHGGTLFLDEVGEMPPTMQGALLRVVQQGEVRRLGGDRVRPIDVRLVAATHRDLRGMVERGEFRQDLLFRLAVVELRVPPLRERPGDVPLLVEHILRRQAQDGGEEKTVEPAAMARLEEHGWPGNVRELDNVLRAASLASREPVITIAEVDHVLGNRPTGRVRPGAPSAAPAPGAPAAANAELLAGSLEEIEKRALQARLEAFGWNQLQAAKSLGMDRNTLHRKILRYGIVRG